MDFLHSTLYGLIQGLTEFLPVSSSGHLALLPYFLNIKDPGVIFDLAMHVGTALAVLCYFRREVLILIKELLALVTGKSSPLNKRNYLINFCVTTLLTVILALFLKDIAPALGRNPKIIAFNLCLFGVLMFIADQFMKESHEELMNLKPQWSKAILIGLFQAMALFPGVSRSGATLTVSRFLGLSRQEAASYSFLLSLPLILGGFVLKLKDFSHSEDHGGLAVALWGMLTSYLIGFLTIHYFLKFIKNLGLWSFSIYRVVLAIFILYFMH